MSSIELKGFKGLKGLDELIIENTASSAALPGLTYLSVDKLQPGAYQPRKHIDNEQLKELSASIQAQGILQPLIVREVAPEGQYEIIAGERRWRASMLAGLTKVPVVIRQVQDETAFVFALIENLQRADLNPIEEAQAFARLQEQFSMTHAHIAQTVGCSRTSVTNMLRLLNLVESVKNLLITGKIDMGHAKLLLALPAEQQAIVAEKIVEKNLTVRATEKLLETQKKPRESKQCFYTQQVDEWVGKLSSVLASKVVININETGEGRLTLHFASPEEVDWVIKKLTDK